MTGYLAFDRDRVSLLSKRLARSLDDLDRCRTGDVGAADADDAIRRAVDRMGPWVGRLGALAGQGVFTDLFTWSGPAGLDAMTIVTDRAPVSTPGDAALAGAVLADRFSRLDLDALTPAQAVTEVQDLLRDADPLVVAAFLREIGPDGLVDLVTLLSQRVDLVGRGDGDSTDIDATMDLARTLGGGLPSVLGSGDWSAVWRSGDPVVVAEVLAGAARGLDDDRLAEISTVVLHRVADLDHADPGPYWRPAGVSVMTTLAERPTAARHALVALDHEDLGFLLFRVDPGAAGSFAFAATDPAFHSPDDARAPITRIVAALDHADDRPWSSDDGVGASIDPSWWSQRESRFTPADPRMPSGIGAVIAPWLGFLVAPVQIAGWTPDPGETEPWSDLDDDALTHALTMLMADEADALPLRLAASTMFSDSLSVGDASQQHAAYVLAAIEDVARSAGYHGIAGQQAAADAIAGSVDLVAGPLSPALATATGFATTAALTSITPDLRDAMADAEAAGFGVAAVLAYGAVAAWRAERAPDSPPLPPLTEPDDVSPDDRADEEAGNVARLVTAWADSIADPVRRREALELYNRVQSAAAQGVGFVA